MKKSIQTALGNFEKKPLADAADGLLNVLGYQSARTLKITPNTAQGFQAMFGREKTLKAEARLEDWLSVDLLFQVSEAEIQTSLNGQWNFTAAKVDNKDIRSYLFFAVELKDQPYTRAQLSGITREINRLFESIPALIVFKHGGLLSIGIIARRLSKKDNSKDVLEKVTIIKDISFASPHRAHLEILLDLSIDELQSKHRFGNFAELQKAWEQVLDTSALNKKFFREVADWYFWAVDTVKFPTPTPASPVGKNADRGGASTEMSVIRLITRLIFVWFIKEKGLVPPELFDERKLKELLYFNDPNKSSYYKAILQNLFFATLNTIMGADRKFRSKNKNPNGLDGHHGVTTLYRYEDQFKAPKEALKLFANIPFLNGGLFECLDKSEEKIYIDGFSDTPKNQPVVPDELFFGAEQDYDLNEIYDTKNRKYKVRGLIHIFNDYKFTIEENTPIEEEIALDPELLGKVFENLLAAYNPETGSTARKQTGSFYTPREIVNYMVDEALIAYLESSLKDLTGFQNLSGLQDKLRHLFAYNNQAPLFNEAETLKLIEAINNLKAFDPACGSGAFPMGMLHKLVFVLKKLDPDNSRWREFQISKVADFPELVAQVEDSFKNNNDDYGRKLYLIQNCIYGTDIQPIAVQITKLRFFISLVVEQKVDDSKPNRGIQPLPNLETKFVAANTLIGIQRPESKEKEPVPSLSPELTKKCETLVDVFRQYNKVSKPELKAKYLEQAKELGNEINKALKNRPDFQPLQVEWIFQTTNSVDLIKERLPLERPVTAMVMTLRNPVIDEKEKQLAEARKRHFSARTPATKTKYREQDKKLRRELADLLKKDGWGSETAQQLAGWDPYNQNAHADFFDPEWMFGIEGGFDVVIGNPPYGMLQPHNTEKATLDFFNSHYEVASFKIDLFHLFIESSISILKSSGNLLLIIPNTFITNVYSQKLRDLIASKCKILQIIVSSERMFAAAEVNNAIVNFQKDEIATRRANNQISIILDADIDFLAGNPSQAIFHSVKQGDLIFLGSGSWNIKLSDDTARLINGFLNISEKLGAIAKINRGLISGDRDKYFSVTKKGEKWLPIITGTNIERYFIQKPKEYVLFEKPKGAGGSWDSNVHFSKKVVVRQIGYFPIASYDTHPYCVTGNVFTIRPEDAYQAEYILAILNSKFTQWLWQLLYGDFKAIFPELKGIYLEQFPIRRINTENPTELSAYNTMVLNVTQILAAKRANPQADTSKLEGEIDQLVYQLYGLTEDEVKVVEGKA